MLQAMKFPQVILTEVFESVWQDLKPQVESHIQTLQQCNTSVGGSRADLIQLGKVPQTVSYEEDPHARRAKQKPKLTEIQQWLASSDSLQRHERARRIREEVPGSGSWLLTHPTYTSWRLDDAPQKPVLWVNGIVGAGKTILASSMIDDCRNDESR